MSIWLILRNLGLIKSLFFCLRDLVSGVATSKEMPPKEKIKELLDQVRALLDSGVIDVPNVDEKQVSEAIKQIEDTLLA